MTLVVIFWTILCVSLAFVSLWGDRDQKICTWAFAVASILSALAVSPMAVRYSLFEWRIFTVDVALLAVFLRFVFASRKYWPLWMTGFQVVEVLGHTAVFLPSSRRAYALTLGIMGYLILAALLIAAWRHRQRRMAARRDCTALPNEC
jgi:hypothetical protein